MVPAAAESTHDSTTDPTTESVADSAAVDTLPAADNGADLPMPVATLTLPSGFNVIDAVFDPRRSRYLVTDGGTLYLLDAADLTLLATYAHGGGGLLQLDSVNDRLYAASGPGYVSDDQPRVLVYDLARLTAPAASMDAALVGRIDNARYVAVDSEHDRLFVSNALTYPEPGADLPVRVLDDADFSLLGEIEQAGIPFYNPVRDEVLIVAHTVYAADPETGAILRDLFPELTVGIPFLYCSGCPYVDWIRVFAEDGLLAVNLQYHAPQGAGAIAPQTWLDAATLEPMTDPVQQPELQAACGSGGALLLPTEDGMIRSRRYARYVVFQNMLLTDGAGNELSWRDGLYGEYIDPDSGRIYLRDGRVLDGGTTAPVADWPGGCVFVVRPETGRLLTADGPHLALVATRGGDADPLPPLPGTLPAEAVVAIHPSPVYAEDATVVISTGTALYRSVDGGNSWVQLRGGLPSDSDLYMDARFSPAFGDDRTLFAFGYRRDYAGDGVWQSTDGGDTWQPRWTGLTHLRINALWLSTDFAVDGTLVAEANYFRIDRNESGRSYHRSTDRGLTWHLAVTATGGTALPPVATLLPVEATPPLPVRTAEYGRALERQAGDGSWQRLYLPFASDELVVSIQGAQPDTLYVLTDLNLFRTQDGGRSWSRWNDPRLDGRTFADDLGVMALAPTDDAGGHRIFIGTANGEVWAIDPPVANWSSMTPPAPEPAPPMAAPMPPPTVSIPVTPTPAAATQDSAAWVAETYGGPPPDGLYAPSGAHGELWRTEPSLPFLLGWAVEPHAQAITAARQPFERGEMIWRGDTATIIARFDAMGWQAVPDSWTGEEPPSPDADPPAGLLRPVRGFGHAWSTTPGLPDLLGWATSAEMGIDALVQEFERGTLLIFADGAIVAIGATPDGTRGWWLGP